MLQLQQRNCHLPIRIYRTVVVLQFRFLDTYNTLLRTSRNMSPIPRVKIPQTQPSRSPCPWRDSFVQEAIVQIYIQLLHKTGFQRTYIVKKDSVIQTDQDIDMTRIRMGTNNRID